MLIDAFMFGGELDLLEIRLAELYPVVDHFVIVESLEQHGSANLKPPTFLESGTRYLKYFHKIKYSLLRHLKPEFTNSDSAWARENFQRNQLMDSIKELDPRMDDVMMLSDADEIPRASHVSGWTCFHDRLYAATQDMFYYNVNTYTGSWHGTVMGTLGSFIRNGNLQDARLMRDGVEPIPDCGWHFSYFGGLDAIRHKTRNFAHAQEDICKLFQYRTDEEVNMDIFDGRDLYHRHETLFEHRSSDDPRLPKYFLENKERFRNLWTT